MLASGLHQGQSIYFLIALELIYMSHSKWAQNCCALAHAQCAPTNLLAVSEPLCGRMSWGRREQLISASAHLKQRALLGGITGSSWKWILGVQREALGESSTLTGDKEPWRWTTLCVLSVSLLPARPTSLPPFPGASC